MVVMGIILKQVVLALMAIVKRSWYDGNRLIQFEKCCGFEFGEKNKSRLVANQGYCYVQLVLL